MDIKTVSTYRNLEIQAIEQSKKRAFSRDTIRKSNSMPNTSNTPSDTKIAQPTTKGLDYNA